MLRPRFPGLSHKHIYQLYWDANLTMQKRRKVKGPDAELVNSMLDAAIETDVTNTDRPVMHSDRGGHYRWSGWLTRISDARRTRSISRKACSTDNSACAGC